MKKHLILTTVLASLSFSQAFAQNIPQKPKFLELSKYMSLAGLMELRHITDTPRTNLTVVFNSPETKNIGTKILEADLSKLSCDGDFALMFDSRGYPYLLVNSIKVCINADGFVVANSVGMPALAKDKIAASVRLIEESHLAARPNAAINQTTLPKAKVNPNEGVFTLPKTGTDSTGK